MIITPKTKIKKHIYSLFITLSIVAAYFCSTAYAGKVMYNNVPYEVAKHFKVRTIPTEIMRSIGYEILLFLGKIVDFMYDVVNTLAQLNLYDVVKTRVDFDSIVYPIAWAVLSLALCVLAIYIMVSGDKFQYGDAVRNSVMSVVLIVCLPTFFSALGDMKNDAVNVVNSIDVTGVSYNSTLADTSGLISSDTHPLGEQIIASNIIPITACVDSDEMVYYNETNLYATKSVYDLYINSWFDNEGDYNYKYTAIQPHKAIPKTVDESQYDSLEEKAALLDCEHNLTRVNNWYAARQTFTFACTEFNEKLAPADPRDPTSVYTYELNRVEYENKVLEYLRKILPDSETSAHNVIEQLLEQDEEFMSSLGSRKISIALRTVTDSYYESLLQPIVEEYNEYQELHSGEFAGEYELQKLKTADDLAELNTLESLNFKYLMMYDSGEAIYQFDFKFLETLITLVITIICLVFISLKFASLLYDVVFLQVIAPVVIASSIRTSDRTKKIVQETISCFLLFVIVILVFKIYLIVILWVMKQDFNFVIKCCLFIGGAKFTIDGPDIITKLIGLDAGVKSGYGAMMATASVVRTATSTTQSMGNTANKIGNTIVKGVRGAYQSPQTIADKAGNIVGGVQGRIDNIRSHINNNSYSNFETNPSSSYSDNTQSSSSGSHNTNNSSGDSTSSSSQRNNNSSPNIGSSSSGTYQGNAYGSQNNIDSQSYQPSSGGSHNTNNSSGDSTSSSSQRINNSSPNIGSSGSGTYQGNAFGSQNNIDSQSNQHSTTSSGDGNNSAKAFIGAVFATSKTANAYTNAKTAKYNDVTQRQATSDKRKSDYFTQRNNNRNNNH